MAAAPSPATNQVAGQAHPMQLAAPSRGTARRRSHVHRGPATCAHAVRVRHLFSHVSANSLEVLKIMDWVPIVFIVFKVLVFGTCMFFAIKWHYDQGKKKK
jgi:hypothetical protein